MEDAELLQSHEDALPENVLSIAREFWAGFAAVDRIDRPAVSVFGSARAREDSPVYASARSVGRRFAELTPDEVTALPARLEESTGGRISLDTQVDPSLLGGLVVRVGDRLIDGSVRGRLERLRNQLISGAL